MRYIQTCSAVILALRMVSKFDRNIGALIGATQEHLCSAHLEDQEDQDETKRTGVVDSSSDRSRATE